MAAIIEVDGLAKSYPGLDRPAVAGLTFSINEGEIFGLLGPNGAGKTTAISMLSCLTPPSRGTARILGHDLLGEQREVKRVIGVVPQDLALYPTLSAYDNLMFFGGLYGLSGRKLRERVDEALAMIHLTDRAHDPIGKLSGGMKRRVNIAAGLLHRPRVLFLDEPTVGVDPQSRNFIFENVEMLKRGGLAVLYTTHYMEEAERLCDRLAIIERGQLIALDTPKALIGSRPGVIVVGVGGRPAKPVSETVAAIEGVITVSAKDDSVTVKAGNPGKLLARIVEAVAGTGLEIRSVEIIEQNLEAVFLELTGRRLRD